MFKFIDGQILHRFSLVLFNHAKIMSGIYNTKEVSEILNVLHNHIDILGEFVGNIPIDKPGK